MTPNEQASPDVPVASSSHFGRHWGRASEPEP
jgi:hypothetical protein